LYFDSLLSLIDGLISSLQVDPFHIPTPEKLLIFCLNCNKQKILRFIPNVIIYLKGIAKHMGKKPCDWMA